MAEDDKSLRRPPPAFQEYASDLLASEAVRSMTLEELGLFAALRWACWHNQDVPREPESLARLLGKDLAEVQRAMTPAVMAFFEPTARTPSRLHAPELTNQRKRMHAKSDERRRAGSRGAKARWAKGKPDALANGSANGSLSRSREELTGGKISGDEDDIPF